MTKNDFFNYTGFIIAISVLLAGFILFFRDTGEPVGSLGAAALLSGLTWITYVIIRWMVIASKKS